LLYPHDLLFLMPIRNLIEGRNNGLLDTTLYSAIGILDKGPLNGTLSGKASGETLFQRYGQTDEDRALPKDWKADMSSAASLKTERSSEL